MSTLGARGKAVVESINFLGDNFVRQRENPYHPENNPDGVINMGTSENHLVYDLLKEKLKLVDLESMPDSYMHYCDFVGLPEFREALARFMTRYMKAKIPVDPDNLCTLVGVGEVVEAAAFCLFDEGDGVLIPSPYYGAFSNDLNLRAKVVPVGVDLSSVPCEEYGEKRPFELSLQRIVKAYEESLSSGIRVKGLLLTNPHNPLGYIYPEELIQQCMEFCHQNKMHIIIDEVYLLSRFENTSGIEFKSTLSMDNIPDPSRTHVLYGFSKDFGVSGFRCGVIHSWNKDFLVALNKSAYFGSVPTIAQYALESFITDFDWLDNKYIPVYQQRLRDVHEYTRNELRKVGIFCFPAESGLFAWVDFRSCIRSQTFEGEFELFEEFFDNKVYLTPCQGFFGKEPGWFRIIIAKDMTILKKGLERILLTLSRRKSETVPEAETDNLGTLVGMLQTEIRQSNWLSENTAEKWQKDNPELARQYLEQIQQSCSLGQK